MALDREQEGLQGEPTPPLTLDKQTVTQGEQLHIRLVGPPGGRATAEFVPLGAFAAERESPELR